MPYNKNFQTRHNGKVIDLFDDAGRCVMIMCFAHGKRWNEVEDFDIFGGSACSKCCDYSARNTTKIGNDTYFFQSKGIYVLNGTDPVEYYSGLIDNREIPMLKGLKINPKGAIVKRRGIRG